MVKCNRCNSENPENASVCQNCGEKLHHKTPKKGISIIILVGLLMLVLGLTAAILIFSSTSDVAPFDQSLIKAVKNGNSTESLISQIKEHSELNRQGSKKGYDDVVSGIQSNNSTFIEESKANYEKELTYILKIEDLQIRFAKREISEDTFIKEIKQLYRQQPEYDY
jgi:hypothetical protein